jgi:hypothetical protein
MTAESTGAAKAQADSSFDLNDRIMNHKTQERKN